MDEKVNLGLAWCDLKQSNLDLPGLRNFHQNMNINIRIKTKTVKSEITPSLDVCWKVVGAVGDLSGDINARAGIAM